MWFRLISAMVCSQGESLTTHTNQMKFKVITIAVALGAASLTTTPAKAFGFGQLIKAVGGAAGVAPITNVIGEVVHQEEVRKTNKMLRDNGLQVEANEDAIEAEVERRLAKRLGDSNPQQNPMNINASNNSQNNAVEAQMNQFVNQIEQELRRDPMAFLKYAGPNSVGTIGTTPSVQATYASDGSKHYIYDNGKAAPKAPGSIGTTTTVRSIYASDGSKHYIYE